MLKTSIDLNNSINNYAATYFNDMTLGEDMSYISGYMESNNALLFSRSNYLVDEKHNKNRQVSTYVKEFTCKGYIIKDTEYAVATDKVYGDYILYKGTRHYSNNGKIYIVGGLQQNKDTTIYNVAYDIIDNGNYSSVTIPDIIYIEEDHVSINGQDYYIDFAPHVNEDGEVNPIEVDLGNGVKCPVILFGENDVRTMARVMISATTGISLSLQDAQFAYEYKCITYKGKPYEVHETPNGLYVSIPYGSSGEIVVSGDVSSTCFEIDGLCCPINKEWRTTTTPKDDLFLMFNDEDVEFKVGDEVLVNSNEATGTRYFILEEDTVEDIFPEGLTPYDTVEINGMEYDVDKLNEGNPYFGVAYINNEPNLFQVYEGYALRCDSEGQLFPYSSVTTHQYYYAMMEGKRYKVEKMEEMSGVMACYINDIERYTYIVDDVIGPSVVRCKPTAYYKAVANMSVVTNKNSMSYSLFYPLFDMEFVDKENKYPDGTMVPNESLSLYVNEGFYTIPIGLTNAISIRPQMEDTIERKKTLEIASDAINDITDLERDIYYPACVNDGKITLVRHLVFDLHFRSRNLEDWSVVKDNNINGPQEGSNWNISDNYFFKPSIRQKAITNINPYYQPSDLLCYLGFSDIDVMQNKKSLSNSYLRLSFYDSKDAENQLLVYSSKIYMDGNAAYKKYIDFSASAIRLDGSYKFMDILAEKDDGIYNAGCTNEPMDGGKFSYKENMRLDSRISVSDKFETKTSSDGFYLYVYKDYSEGLKNNKLYMRVQFVNAKYGKVCNMYIPHDAEGNAIDLSTSQTNHKKLTRGMKLSEIMDNLYIPLTGKYDYDNKRYIYYFPNQLVYFDEEAQTLHFNLYETKAADESEDERSDDQPYMFVDTDMIDAEAQASTQTVGLYTENIEGEITGTSDVNWITDIECTEASVTFTVAAFTGTGATRVGTITLNYGSAEATITVVQHAPLYIQILYNGMQEIIHTEDSNERAVTFDIVINGSDEGLEVSLDFMGGDEPWLTYELIDD